MLPFIESEKQQNLPRGCLRSDLVAQELVVDLQSGTHDPESVSIFSIRSLPNKLVRSAPTVTS